MPLAELAGDRGVLGFGLGGEREDEGREGGQEMGRFQGIGLTGWAETDHHRSGFFYDIGLCHGGVSESGEKIFDPTRIGLAHPRHCD
ncbi:hypothetical protein HAHE_24750 [Haloferula helveola]|uniref:Uncharacterized protein n=1 Tax=Haloferula helveola TaxID=490095 RepID=A0ABN6H4H0_9BACT|nr:hypothetical protein HAHE_24750 [Haloferula helveola]